MKSKLGFIRVFGVVSFAALIFWFARMPALNVPDQLKIVGRLQPTVSTMKPMTIESPYVVQSTGVVYSEGAVDVVPWLLEW